MSKKTGFLILGLISLLGISGFILQTIDPERSSFIELTLAGLLISFVFVLSINLLLNKGLNFILPWKKRSGLRFIAHLVLGTCLSLVVLNLAYQIIKSSFTEAPPEFGQLVLLNVYGMALLLPIYSLFFGVKFLRAWRKADLESEILQKENSRSQMMMLRNHLDPHFLFNNLNTLSSLIDIDRDLSKQYLDKFAEVYRSILRTEQTDLTTVREELEMIESYVFLLNIRFQNAFTIDVNVDDQDLDMAIPPLSIQMLIENALKHNVTSKKKPMHMSIESESSAFLIVTNTLQKKIIQPNSRIGTGIDNIRTRYEFFTEKKVDIIETMDVFKVRLPLIKVEPHLQDIK